MAEFQPQSEFGRPFESPASVLAQESARTFMARVYQWMVGGLAVTGVTAAFVAMSPSLLNTVMGFYMPLLIAELVLVFALSFLAPKVSGPVAAIMFIGYAFMTGLTFSVLFYVYSLGSVAVAFGITSVMFIALSVYATVTKRDLSAWGTFLFMGLIGLILSGIVNIFLQSPAVTFISSCAGVVIFAGLTAYDTQKLRQIHANSGYSSAGALAVTGALILYLDFINLFLKLLQLFGRRR